VDTANGEEDSDSEEDDADRPSLEPLNLNKFTMEPSKIERQEWVYAIYELNADLRHMLGSMCPAVHPAALCAS
jgi:hypothetical protein